jgi:uncharacterized protein
MPSNTGLHNLERFSRLSFRTGEVPQLSLIAILGLWLLVAGPMALLSLGVVPILVVQFPDAQPGLIFWGAIIVGMAWQTAVSLGVLLAEGQRWTWGALKRRFWLRMPRDPQTGRRVAHWVCPIVFFGTIFVLASDLAFAWLDRAFVLLLPSWMLPAYGDITLLATPQNTGNWALVGIALISALFNYVLGEALFFHGVLLPRMEGVFGRWAWVANAVLFGCYHVHKAGGIPTIIIACLAYSLPAQYTRSLWPALLIHGLEGLFLIVAVLFVVLGGAQ